ncbi:MAG: D-alanyl-D-alanine carboxypeptidase/D-alanyl-D-alanine-endopeptidase [Planctomycetes bacterium]|nr:D-alanyl-D-alanine carboxypeptidase/D-alanyl-D-alanine-endopeptidase [Planctomycetota bacterium]
MARIRPPIAANALVVPLFAALFAALCASCASTGAGRADVTAAVERVVAASRTVGGRIGVVVLDGGDGEVLAAHAADAGFLPASNLKVLTAAVALASLGPDHRFATGLLRAGPVQDAVLHGDLFLLGHGDPTLGSAAPGAVSMQPFVEALLASGVRRVEGRVYGDDGWLGAEHLGRGWQWDHLREDFAAPFGALCWHGNVDDGGVPVREPAIAAAAALVAALRAAGVECGEPAAGVAPARADSVHVVYSASLAELLPRMLGDSDNLYAEQFWRAAARVATGDGSSAAAETHSKDVLARLGVDAARLAYEDGSGLSRRDLAQPMQIARTLVALLRSPDRAVFEAAMPLAGVSGTLATRFVDGPARGVVRAKTGTLSRVACLSGWVPRDGREPLVFSVLWNDFPAEDEVARAVIDAFVQDLAGAAAVRT